MTNPFTPPEMPPDVLDRTPAIRPMRPRRFSWAMKIGGLAGTVSAICIAVFFNFSHVVYDDNMARMRSLFISFAEHPFMLRALCWRLDSVSFLTGSATFCCNCYCRHAEGTGVYLQPRSAS